MLLTSTDLDVPRCVATYLYATLASTTCDSVGLPALCTDKAYLGRGVCQHLCVAPCATCGTAGLGRLYANVCLLLSCCATAAGANVHARHALPGYNSTAFAAPACSQPCIADSTKVQHYTGCPNLRRQDAVVQTCLGQGIIEPFLQDVTRRSKTAEREAAVRGRG